MLCLSGFELYSRWVPLTKIFKKVSNVNYSCVNRAQTVHVFFPVLWHKNPAFS